MSWHTFAGEYHEIYNALIKAWCTRHNLPTDEYSLIKYFKLHLNRGIAYLAGTNHIKSIDDLIELAFRKRWEHESLS
jgi:DNA sulfur modification protein DndE